MANRIKSDGPTKAIVAALKSEGASVEYIRQRRGKGQKGLPDLLVGFNGKNFLLEVKAKTGILSDEQKKWHLNWTGAQVHVVSDELEALIAIGLTP